MLRRLIDVRREEVAALAWAWLYIFAVLSSYYIMRPIRDQMGVAGGVNNLQWLFTGTLVGMLCLNVPFAYLVKTLPRTRFIPISYRFFAANILVFAALLYFADNAQTIWIGRAFFIWISIFNLFVVSVFWALIVDIFSSEQGKRLFGFIAAGATIGAIAGSGLTASLARYVPVTFLLIGSVLLLEVAVFAVRRLSRLAGTLHAEPASVADRPMGGSVFAGITHPFKSAYLLNVSVFILLFAITATFLYFEQAGIVSRSFADRGAQTAFFATIDLLVNCLTLAVAAFPHRPHSSLLRRRARARLPSAPDVVRIRDARLRSGALRPRRLPGAAPLQRLRYRPPGARSALHRRAARGPLQGEELHRHGGLSRRRPDRRLVVCAAARHSASA